jgi:quinol monooxygenase YgiN
MAVQVHAHYPGVTREAYDAMIPQVEERLRAEPSFIAHLRAPAADGWRVIEVWESRAAADAWLRERIAPMMAAAGRAAPDVQVQPVHYVIVAQYAQ